MPHGQLSRRQAQVECHWSKFWWLLYHILPFHVVSQELRDTIPQATWNADHVFTMKVRKDYQRLSSAVDCLPWSMALTLCMHLPTVRTLPLRYDLENKLIPRRKDDREESGLLCQVSRGR